jgi:hypothetical protein
MKTAVIVTLLAAALCSASEALAQGQQLIPTPNDGAHMLVAPPTRHHQYLVPTPYPNSLGPNALGDPHLRTRSNQQRLIPNPYPRALGKNSIGDPPVQSRRPRQRGTHSTRH